MIIIPFRNQPRTIDIGLSQKLEAELPGIFAWCYSMPTQEMKQIILSAGTIQAVAEISIERFESNNPEFRFLCELFPEGKASIKAGDLYTQYVNWCSENHLKPKSNVKFASTIQTMKCKRSPNKINGNYYYIIPRMKNFDISSHLGIVKRQSGDSCRDSSNAHPEGDRDSCRQFESKKSLDSNSLEENPKKQSEELDTSKVSTSVSEPLCERDVSVSSPSSLSLTVSNNQYENLSDFSDDQLIPDPWDDAVELAESGDWLPKIGDRVLVQDEGTWKPATIITEPNEQETDLMKRRSFWQVKLDSRKEKYVWKPTDFRPITSVKTE